MRDDDVLGRRAILLMVIVFVLVVIGTLFITSPAHAIKRQHAPACVPSTAVDSCKTLFGSSDSSGFVTAKAKPKSTASKGATLLTVVYGRARSQKCEVRSAPENDNSDGKMPRVGVADAEDSFAIVLVDDARLPQKMRWYYQCKGE